MSVYKLKLFNVSENEDERNVLSMLRNIVNVKRVEKAQGWYWLEFDTKADVEYARDVINASIWKRRKLYSE